MASALQPALADAGDTTRPLTWSGLLLDAHRRFGSRVAVLPDETARADTPPLSYDALLAAAARVASALAALGADAGARIVLALDNRPEMVVLERALALWGYVRVALSPRLHPLEIDYIAGDCDATLVICETRHAAELKCAARVVPAEPQPGFALALPDLLDADDAVRAMPSPAPDDVVSLMYTSGTTGRPKGAINTQRAWATMARNVAAMLPPIGEHDVLLHAAPMSHFSGSVSAAYLCGGAAIATLRRFDPAATLARARATRATCVPLVPTMIGALVQSLGQSPEPGARPAPTLRALPYGGSPIAPGTVARARALFGPVLVQFYGMSEALIPVTCLPADEHGPGPDEHHRLSTAGRPVPGCEVRLDAVRDGIGEMCVRGPNVSAGYWSRDGMRAALDAHGWLHTGDLASVDAAGRLRIVDRTRDVLISGGFNIYPAEVERVIAGVAGVADVAVIGVPHERWGEAVMALIVAEPGRDVSDDAILDACRAQLAGYKKPLAIARLDALPKTSTGKTDKRRLRERYWQDRSRQVGE